MTCQNTQAQNRGPPKKNLLENVDANFLKKYHNYVQLHKVMFLWVHLQLQRSHVQLGISGLYCEQKIGNQNSTILEVESLA